MVIALGDPLFARPFESEVEERLVGLGFAVGDEHNSLAVSDVLRRWGGDVAVPELLPLLDDAGFHVLVLIQVEHQGYREVYALGRYSEVAQARIRLNSYVVSTGDPLGYGWSEAVEYAELNAERKAETAMFDATDEMARAVHAGWDAYRRDFGR